MTNKPIVSPESAQRQVQVLRHLASAQFTLGTRWGRASVLFQCLLVANLVPAVRQFAGAWAVLMLGLVAPAARFLSLEYKKRADNVLRVCDLADAFGVEPDPVESADLFAEAGTLAQLRAARLAREAAGAVTPGSYYASAAERGTRRLVEITAENAWFSSKGAGEAKTNRLLWTVLLAVLAFAGLLVPGMSAVGSGVPGDVVELAATLLVFLAAEWSLATWVGLGTFQQHAQRVFDRALPMLRSADEPSQADGYGLLSVYLTARVLSPPLPRPDQSTQGRLNSEWERIRAGFHVHGPPRNPE